MVHLSSTYMNQECSPSLCLWDMPNREEYPLRYFYIRTIDMTLALRYNFWQEIQLSFFYFV